MPNVKHSDEVCLVSIMPPKEMSTMSVKHLENLRNAILKLEPTGQDGFEGLVALLLTVLSGQPFRLASSGPQRGRDGDSAFDRGATYFEAKLYKDKISKGKILEKLEDILIDDQGQVDLFIVCSTSRIPALDAQGFIKLFEQQGIGILLLDWIDSTRLPPLATLVAMGGTVAKDFLTAKLNGAEVAQALPEALTAIDHLAQLPEFETQSDRLRREISNPSVGLGIAKRENHKWFTRVFSCSTLARQQLGQPLAPCDPSVEFIQPRANLCQRLQSAFTGENSKEVFVVTGLEGTGKSWLLANTWLQSDPASILVFVSAGELRDPEDITDFESFLIEKLIGQTGGERTYTYRTRWRRRFAAWKANVEPPNVRITVCIDGLNQNPRFHWSRLIDGAVLLLGQLGGQLVVTTRTTHFQAISETISFEVSQILVPEWSELEIDGILRSKAIEPEVLDAEVFETLRNPRILNIAVNLLNARDIESIGQLSVERLLFEHLRTSKPTGSSSLSGPEFAKALTEVAKEYIARLQAGSEDDLTLFDIRDHSRLDDVSSGRFFKPVDDDPDQYQIVDEGLLLSLGIWLVNALKKEDRNERDPFERLEAVMEPVAGLDMTAEIVYTATVVACVTNSCSLKVKTALIRHFVGLQNLPEHKRESFGALAKESPDAFLEAAKEAAMFDYRVPTSDWLNVAILEGRNNSRVRRSIEQRIPEWLSYYCLAPDRMMRVSARDSSPEEVEAERKRVTSELDDRLEELTDVEKRYMDENLTEIEKGDIDSLHRLAMFLLAGLSLEKFIGPLVSSAFSASLTPTIDVPRRELEHLVRFNFVDWKKTRKAMLEWIKGIGEEQERSSIGNWVIAKALRSTGDPSDAVDAQRLAEMLTASLEKTTPWRLIETFCASDPCDPKSSRPENVSDTAEKYRSIAVEQICAAMGNGTETLFFREAMPGVARFEPEAGVHAIRKLAEHALTRQAVARKLAMLTLLPHSVLLDRREVDELVKQAQSSSESLPNETDISDEWLTTQYSLFIALPHLSGNEQLKALNGIRSESFMLDLLDTTRPAEASVVESLLVEAFADEDAQRLSRLLATVRHTRAPLTAKAKCIIEELVTHPDTTVRAEVLAVASQSQWTSLLTRFIESDWDASRLTPIDHHYELWYGSSALVEAVGAGVIDLETALDRMAFSHYGIAAGRLGDKVAGRIADRVEIALASVLDLGELTNLPEMEQLVAVSDSSIPPMISLREELSSSDSLSHLERFAESNEQFQQRQRSVRCAYHQFIGQVTKSGARLVLDDLTTKGMAAIISARPDVIDRWHSLLMGATEEQKRNAYYFAIRFGGTVAQKSTGMAVELLRAYSGVKPLVSRVSRLARVPTEAEVLWSRGHVSGISELCMERLDDCINDREISIEVLAAFAHNQEQILESYIARLLSTGEPLQIARALTVAGFSDVSQFAEDALARFDGSKGFIGVAHRAASDAYDRNYWSRHWFECMRTATTRIDVWRYSILLSRIVDGRLDLWSANVPIDESFGSFVPTIRRSVVQRIEQWNNKRKKILFGDRIPHAVFLSRN